MGTEHCRVEDLLGEQRKLAAVAEGLSMLSGFAPEAAFRRAATRHGGWFQLDRKEAGFVPCKNDALIARAVRVLVLSSSRKRPAA